MQRRRVDLHTHSTASDGLLTPSKLVNLALDQGLAAIALTDHDTLSGIPEAQAAAADSGLEVIPGIEINAEGPWGDLHLLGFYINPRDATLNEQLRAMQQARVERAQKMVEKLRRLGMHLEWEEVQGLAHGKSIGRPHIAKALLQRRYITHIDEAFTQYIGRSGPAYFPRLQLTPAQAIETIRQAGGVAVLAHPIQSGALNRVKELAAQGLQGLEVFYPNHSPEEVLILQELCERHGLLYTGGSDFHGPGYPEGVLLGSVYVPLSCVDDLRRAAGGSLKQRLPSYANSVHESIPS